MITSFLGKRLFAMALLLCLLFGSSGLQARSTLNATAHVRYAQVGDIKMAYYTRGQDRAGVRPLLMINGFISTMSLWDPAMLELLEKDRKIILFDNRGAGLSSDTAQNNTTIPQMADDAAGLIRTLGYDKVDMLGWSMGARIGQQLLIRHPDLVGKAVLCAADPGGSQSVPAAADVEARLNDPNLKGLEKIALTFPDNAQGRDAAKAALARLRSAVKAGTIPDDFTVSRETTIRQTRARTELWRADDSNFADLKGIKIPVLLADGRDDLIDPPRNSLNIANQIPFSWVAFLEGGHAFLFQSNEQFANLVNAFLS